MKHLHLSQLLFVILFTGLFVECTPDKKDPIEQRFDQYIQEANISDNFIGIDSITPLDSINLISHYKQITHMKDSVRDELMSEIKAITENMGKLQSRDFSKAVAIGTKLSQVTIQKSTENELKEKISIFLENIPASNAWYKTYKIVATFKDGQKIFYANNIAFEDTIIIAEDIINCQSSKSQRISNYFDRYLMDVYAPQAVLLNDAKSLHTNVCN